MEQVAIICRIGGTKWKSENKYLLLERIHEHLEQGSEVHEEVQPGTPAGEGGMDAGKESGPKHKKL